MIKIWKIQDGDITSEEEIDDEQNTQPIPFLCTTKNVKITIFTSDSRSMLSLNIIFRVALLVHQLIVELQNIKWMTHKNGL